MPLLVLPAGFDTFAYALERGSIKASLGVNIIMLEDDEGKVRVVWDEGEAGLAKTKSSR